VGRNQGFADEPIIVGRAAEWFCCRGDRVSLARRQPTRRVLAALAVSRLDRPGQPVSRHDLLAAGWPGERVLPGAGANRVRVAIATLRKLGLAGAIVSLDHGYLLDPHIPLRAADEEASA
jgi:hypothetical protein